MFTCRGSFDDRVIASYPSFTWTIEIVHTLCTLCRRHMPGQAVRYSRALCAHRKTRRHFARRRLPRRDRARPGRDCGAREACDGRRDAVRDQRRIRPYVVQGNDAARRHVLLGRGPDTGALLAQAVQRGGAFVPGAPFYAGEPERNRLGHSFASATTEQIAEGIRRLRDIHAESKRIADRDGSVEPQ
jgi:hypothetical protein